MADTFCKRRERHGESEARIIGETGGYYELVQDLVVAVLPKQANSYTSKQEMITVTCPVWVHGDLSNGELAHTPTLYSNSILVLLGHAVTVVVAR
jgi:hypothetical protein